MKWYLPRLRTSAGNGFLLTKAGPFYKYDSSKNADILKYDLRPEVTDQSELRVADAKPTEAINVESTQESLKIADKNDLMVPRSNHPIEFSITGPGEIVATDNGDPTNMVSFSSPKREAFNGLCLVIVRSTGKSGTITVKATSQGLEECRVDIKTK